MATGSVSVQLSGTPPHSAVIAPGVVQGRTTMGTLGLFAPGSYFPVAANTGVPFGWTAAHSITNDVTITTTGVTGDTNGYITGAGTATNPWLVQDLDIAGRIICKSPYIVINRCNVHPTGFGTGNTAAIVCTDAGVTTTSTTAFKQNYGWYAQYPDGSYPDYSVIIKDTTVSVDVPSYWYDGVIGHGYLALRVESFHVTDGFGIYSTGSGVCNAHIVACYVHDQTYGANDPSHQTVTTGNGTHGDGSHSDGVQMQGGSGSWVYGTTLDGHIDVTTSSGFWQFANQGNSPAAAGQNYFDSIASNGVNANTGCQVNQTTDATSGGFARNQVLGGRLGINLSGNSGEVANFGSFTAGFYLGDNVFKLGANGWQGNTTTAVAASTKTDSIIVTAAAQANITITDNKNSDGSATQILTSSG